MSFFDKLIAQKIIYFDDWSEQNLNSLVLLTLWPKINQNLK